MTKGIVVFAVNNDNVDYLLQACFVAKRAKQFLNIPVSLATVDKKYFMEKYSAYRKLFDKIIPLESRIGKKINYKRYYDGAFNYKILQFRNSHRCKAYEISPYDETIVIDTDYVINSKKLLKAFNDKNDFLIYKDAVDISGWRKDTEFDFINDTGIEFYWATCFFFRKGKRAELFFNTLNHVVDNYDHYKLIYDVGTETFRNDHAFSIALHILNGNTNSNFAKQFPGDLYYTLDRDLFSEMEAGRNTFLVEKQGHSGEYTAICTNNLDVHVMNKFSLNQRIREEFANG
jgi:hypothetical protein